MEIINYCSIQKGEIANANGIIYSFEDSKLNSFLKSYYKQKKILYPKFYKMDAQCKLAFIASEVLFENFNREDYNDEEIAMVFSNSESTLATDMEYWESAQSIASPALFVYTLPNIMMGEIAIRNKIKGENLFFIAEDFDSDLLLQQTELVFLYSPAKVAVVGWVNYENEEKYQARLFLVSKTGDGKLFNKMNIEKLNKE
ncbi:MAG TPA: hypothetical protein P5210_13820 [Draconibacterium sp.]|nr:hypothetical protein [Draconibacterium sp.]HRX12732.1 hypothetical protein [Draconibacterium sp.]